MEINKINEPNSTEYTILIVDDAPVNLGVLSDYLKYHGFEILVARSGENALKRVQYVQPDIILLDVMMPGIDGFETCQRLKANELTKDIPIIFMTALTETEAKVKAFEFGAVDYVTKPLQQAEVLARVTTHLKIRDLTHNLQEQNLRLQRMAKLLSRRAKQLEATHELGQQVASMLDLEELLVQVVKLIQEKFDYYFVGIWLLTEPKDILVLRAGTGKKNQEGASDNPANELLGYQISTRANHGIAAWVYQTGHVYSTDNVNLDAKYLPLNILPEAQAELALPLIYGTEVIGVLDIYLDRSVTFGLEDRTVMQILATQIAIAIRNARFYQIEKNLRQIEEQRSKELTELNASKDKFFSVLAHDLKSPFLPLLGWLDLLSEMVDTASPDKVKRTIEVTRRTAQNIYNLLENLLSWSKIQMKRIEYRPKELDLKMVIDLNMMLLGTVAFNKGIKLHNEVNQSIQVYADEDMLHTVIRNLVSNAIKFTAMGGEIVISATPQSVGNMPYLEVAVADTGVGISPNELAKLFRLDIYHTTLGTAQEKGTGLGLVMCKEMIEQNLGQIWIESEINQGTVVKFTIPLAQN